MSSPKRRKYSFQSEKFTQVPPAPKADRERERRYSHADIYDVAEAFYNEENLPHAMGNQKKYSSVNCSAELMEFQASKAAAPRLSLATLEQQPPLCRICLLSEEDDEDRLIKPCECKGSMGLVHRACLRKWVNLCNKYHCELCGYHYITEERMPSLMQWMRAILLKRFLKEFLITVVLLVYVVFGCIYCASRVRSASGPASDAGGQQVSVATPKPTPSKAPSTNPNFSEQVAFLSILLLQVAVFTAWILSLVYSSVRSFRKFRRVKRRHTIRQPGSVRNALYPMIISGRQSPTDSEKKFDFLVKGSRVDEELSVECVALNQSPAMLSVIKEQMESPQSDC